MKEATVHAPTLTDVLHSIDKRRVSFGRLDRFLWTAIVFMIGTGIFLVIRITSDTTGAVAALMYMPIVLAAYVFKVKGGVTAAALAGLAVGPLIPSEAGAQRLHLEGARLAVIAGYLLVGIACGVIVKAANVWREDASKLHNSALRTFAALVQTYDTQTGAHCERVAANACTLGKVLGLSDTELRYLYWAGLLHDVGKVVLPKEVLHKPGKLNDAEMELIREHPGVGARLLTGISAKFAMVAEGVGTHHERWDGSGYPLRLNGDQIPLSGRILAIVDTFEAVTSDRPYQTSLAPEAALQVLRRGAGSEFEPRLVSLYEQLYWDGQIQVFNSEDETLNSSTSRLLTLTGTSLTIDRSTLSQETSKVSVLLQGRN